MKHLLALLLLAACAATVQGQTIKSLGYNTTNGEVVYAGTNQLTFTNIVNLNTGTVGNSLEGSIVTMAKGIYDEANDDWAMTFNDGEPQFNGTGRRDEFRNGILAARAPIWAYKATNQTNATTNLVSDTALTFTAAANTKYAVELFLYIEGDNGNHPLVGKIETATNVTFYGFWNRYNLVSGIFPTQILPTQASTLFEPEDSDSASILQKFVVLGPTNTNAVFTFQFAKSTAFTNAGSVIIGAGSYLKAEIIE